MRELTFRTCLETEIYLYVGGFAVAMFVVILFFVCLFVWRFFLSVLRNAKIRKEYLFLNIFGA